ncbi:MAG: hypothetical protein SWJ54_20410, partial [Cyanobacteriota bacterium]|nr:hypothetical protein [Cyanobacteriota bacterium]
MPNILDTLQDDSRFDKIKKSIDNANQSIEKLSDIADNLADQTLNAVESGMRLGYAYAQVEADIKNTSEPYVSSDENIIDIEAQSLLPTSSQVLDQDYLKDADHWTKESLKARFGTCQKAYRYLQDTYQFKFQRSWDKIVEAFNTGKNFTGNLTQSLSLEQQVSKLEQTMISQAQR